MNVLQHKNTKARSVDSYDIWPGNVEGLFWFQRFINLSLTYLLRHLPNYSHGAPTGHSSPSVPMDNVDQILVNQDKTCSRCI